MQTDPMEAENTYLPVTREQLTGICSLALLMLLFWARVNYYGVLPPSYFLLIPSFVIGVGSIGIPVLLFIGFTIWCFKFRMNRQSDPLPLPLPSWFLFLAVAGFSGHYHFSGPLRTSQYVSDAMTTWWTVAYLLIGVFIAAALGLATALRPHRAHLTVIANALMFFWLFTYAFAYAGEMP